MDIPVKRTNLDKSLVKSPQKRLKKSSDEKSSQSIAIAASLRRDLWKEIIDFLDTKSYFYIVPQLNSFFYSIVKECKNYKTTLSFLLKVDNTNYYIANKCQISKNTNCMEYILYCNSLQKLELKLENCHIPNEENVPRLAFADYFTPMKSLKILKVLKIHTKNLILMQVENLLTLFENLEVLKVNFHEDFPSGYYFIKNKYIDSFEVCSHKVLLKKLSLKYLGVQNNCKNIDQIIDSIDKNIGLEKFSFKVTKESHSKIEIPRFFKTNFNLKCIKLPSTFLFNKISSEELCNYLARSEILEELQVSDTAMINSEQFINAILINRSLKILVLKHDTANYHMKFDIKFEIIFELFNALAQSLIEDFSMIIYDKNSINICGRWTYGAINLFEKFLECFDNFLSTSEKIRKIVISFHSLPTKYIVSLADLIIKHVKLGKIESFAGYNLKMLMENKLEILELGKKDKLFGKNNQMNAILSEIFRKLLVNADKVLRIVQYNDPKITLSVEKFIQSIAESKTLILKQHISSQGREIFSPLFYYSMIILSTRIKDIIVLDIRSLDLEPYHNLFHELLNEFKSLKKLKLNISSNGNYDYDFSNIFKTISKSLNKVSHINFSSNNKFCKSFEEVFLCLIDFEPLRNFKFKNSTLAVNNYFSYTKLDSFLSRSQIISLNLSGVAFAYDQLTELAKGLEVNKTIIYLKLENIKYVEIKGIIRLAKEAEKRKTEGFLKIISALRLKIYEKISLFPSNGYTNGSLTSDEHSKQYLASITDILSKNLNLKEFNVRIALPDKFLFSYSEIILKAIENNKSLKVINFFDIEKLFLDDKKALSFASEYYQKSNSWKLDNTYWNLCKLNVGFDEIMPIVFSELIKKCPATELNRFIGWVFEGGNSCTPKTLSLGNFNANYEKRCKSFKYNLLDNFTFLEEIIMLDEQITFSEFQVLEKNLKKLEHLKTIILKNYRYNISDLYAFLAPKNIINLKSYKNSLNIDNIAKLSEKTKSSQLEKLILKDISFSDDLQVSTYFHIFLESIVCPSLRILKIYTKYTHELLNILINKLVEFKNLEHLCISISEDYHNYQSPLKNLVSILQTQKTLLSKVKVYKYTWDIGKLKVKKEFEFSGCRLNPADLILFTELCEGKILENVGCVNLSENVEIIDAYFAENIAKIIGTLGCSKVIMKKIGCEQRRLREIKSLLGNEEGSLVDFILDN